MPAFSDSVSASPLRGWLDPQLSERRANVLADAATLDSDGAIGKFRQDFTSMGLVDHIVDFFTGGEKADILKALALCHIASFPGGQTYLSGTGELADVAESQRYLLDRLTPTARDGLFGHAQYSTSGEIVLTLALSGNAGLQLALRAESFGDGAGAITPHEAVLLLKSPVEGGKNLLSQLAEAGSEKWGAGVPAIAARIALLETASSGLTGTEVLTSLSQACERVIEACKSGKSGYSEESIGMAARALFLKVTTAPLNETTVPLTQGVAVGSGPEEDMTAPNTGWAAFPMEIWGEIDSHLGMADRGAFGLTNKGAAPLLATTNGQRLVTKAMDMLALPRNERTATAKQLLTAVGQLDKAYQGAPLIGLAQQIWQLPQSEQQAYADGLLTAVGELDKEHRGPPLLDLAKYMRCLPENKRLEYAKQLFTAVGQLDPVHRGEPLLALAGQITALPAIERQAYADRLLTAVGQLDKAHRGPPLLAIAQQILNLPKSEEQQAYIERLLTAVGELDKAHRGPPLLAIAQRIWWLPASEWQAYTARLLTAVGQLDSAHRGEPLIALAKERWRLPESGRPAYAEQLLREVDKMDQAHQGEVLGALGVG